MSSYDSNQQRLACHRGVGDSYTWNHRKVTKWLDCFSWDTNCRNRIDTFRSQLLVVDKLTDKVIWKTPSLFANDIIVKKQVKKMKLVIANKIGIIYTIE